MPRNLLINGEILLYGVIGDLGMFDDGILPGDVATALAEHGAGDVAVRINSAGGIAVDGMAIYSLFKSHPGKVTMIIDGIAASAASLIMMAGADRKIRRGATVMIHDPASVTFGTEDVHLKKAGSLGKLGESYAGVYAAASGKSKVDARAIMKAESWFTADEAVKEGFATIALDDEVIALAEFDYRIYAHVPRGLPVRMRISPTPAASAALKEQPAMKKDWAAAFYTAAESSGLPIADLNAIVAKHDTQELANAALAAAVKAKKDKADADALALAGDDKGKKSWAGAFYASAENSGLKISDLNAIVAKADTLDKAKDALIDAMAAAGDKDKPGAGVNITLGVEDRQKFVTGATKSVIAKVALFNEGGKPDKDGERNEFSQFSMRELARMSLERSGVKLTAIHDPMQMVKMAMAPVFMSSGMHSTSDFVNILANVANKSMLKGYEEAAETFQEWTAKGTLTDFKISTRVDLGLFPSLAKVVEGAEYSYATLSDRQVTLVLATYGKIFAITRQAIINDDLGAFTRIPSRMGRAAKRTIGDLVYAVLTANAAMADNVALFHADHKNLQTGSALAVATLDAGRALMAKQRDPDSKSAALNIRPAFLLTPVALEGVAKQLMASQTEPGQSNPNLASKVTGMAKPIAEARLDVNSATTWYLTGSPAQYDTIEVSYLNGVEAPVLEQKDGWNVDGVEFKVRQDAGVNLLDFRALQKSTA